MENGILPGAAEIEYWKWTGVVLCLASALLSRRKDKPGDPLPIFILTSCALADLFLLFTTQWEIGIAVFCLVQLCLSFILISREQTIQLCLITGGLVFIAGLLLKLPKLICLALFYTIQTAFNLSAALGNSDRYFSVKADSGQAEGDQIRVSVLGYSNPDLDIGWGCAVSLVRSECRAFSNWAVHGRRPAHGSGPFICRPCFASLRPQD